jgi:WD40 repeat protein
MVVEHYPDPPEIWSLQKGARAFKPAEVKDVDHLGFSQDGNALAILKFNGVYVYNLQSGALTGKIMTSVPAPYEQIYFGDIALSPDGSLLAIDCSYDRVQAFELWDVRSGKRVSQWSNPGIPPDSQSQVGFSPDGKWAALAVENSTFVFNGKTGALARTFNGGKPAAFSPDSRYLTTATAQGDIYLYSLDKGILLANLRGHSKRPDTVIFQPGGRLLASLQFSVLPASGIVGFWGIPAAGTVIARAGISVQQGVSSISDGVPEAWLASGGKAARFQIQITLENATLSTCPYTGNHTLVLKQQIENVVVIDLETNAVIGQNKFYGKRSVFWPGCPKDRSFSAPTEEVYVTEPDIEGFGAWLAALMKPYGFTR